MVLLLFAPASSAANPSIKRLIELGWDSPTPNVTWRNLETMEQGPFDGLVISLNAGKTIFNH